MKPITDDTICQIYNNLTDFGYVVDVPVIKATAGGGANP